MIAHLYITVRPAMQSWPLVLFMGTSVALYCISQKQIIRMEATKFATRWYYSCVQLIDG